MKKKILTEVKFLFVPVRELQNKIILQELRVLSSGLTAHWMLKFPKAPHPWRGPVHHQPGTIASPGRC